MQMVENTTNDSLVFWN